MLGPFYPPPLPPLKRDVSIYPLRTQDQRADVIPTIFKGLNDVDGASPSEITFVAPLENQWEGSLRVAVPVWGY